MGKKFNEILIGLRKSSGLTQAEFAQKIGVSRSTIGNYEKGVRRPDFETTEAIQERGGWKTDHIMKSVYTETFSEERERVDGIIDGYFEKFV